MTAAASAIPEKPRLSPGGFVFFFSLAAVLLASFVLTDSNPVLLFRQDSLNSMANFLSGFLRPDFSAAFLREIGKPVLETIQLATAGTFLALLFGAPLSLFAASTFTLGGALFEGDPDPGPWKKRFHSAVYLSARFVLNFMRSIPELVWALMFVRAVGLGPAPGVLGLGVAYAGVVGKVFAEILEGADLRPAISLRAAGASLPKVIFYGVVPTVFRTLLSYTLYRWECAMRAAAILGFVGAGGLGQQIEISMRMFEHGQTATLILALFALVAGADVLSAFIRRRIS
ncbi:MAG: phosphate/phosphonate ABC transporter permease [bacterium]|nr:phosphate/phosphonate ABC transporter permease [bacterium]